MTIPLPVAEAAAALVLDGPPVAAEVLSGGHIHQTWVVSCTAGERSTVRYVVQRINTGVFVDPVALSGNIALVLEHLHSPLVVIPTREGAPLWCSPRGDWWRAFGFVEGTVTSETVQSADMAAELGRAFGDFHRDTADLDPQLLAVTLPGFHDPVGRRRHLDALVRADPCGRVAGVRDELSELACVDQVAEQAGTLIAPSLPIRVAHFDAKPANVLFDAVTGRARCVIDLDTVTAGSWLWDVGDLIRSATCMASEDSVDLDAVAVDLDLYRALLGGYLAEAGAWLSAEERAGVVTAGLVVTYEQAVRFLTDHLAGDAYYPVGWLSHNRDRFRVQLRLLQSMLRCRSEMVGV